MNWSCNVIAPVIGVASFRMQRTAQSELMALDTHRLSSVGFPLVISGQVTIPDQVKVLKGYKKRLKKMVAAQKDSDGNHKSNPEAEIAQAQLMQVQRDIVSSSLKTANLSLSVIVCTSRQAVTYRQLEENEQELANHTQEVLNSFQRMNGAKAVLETIAKRRIFIGALPGMGETDKREQDMVARLQGHSASRRDGETIPPMCEPGGWRR